MATATPEQQKQSLIGDVVRTIAKSKGAGKAALAIVAAIGLYGGL
jgi:phenylpyruvate tautomerase PptA (4-oxalocrotonate tautomerase family)